MENDRSYVAKWVLYSKIQNPADLLLQLKMESIQEAYSNICPLKVNPEEQCNYNFHKATLLKEQCLKTGLTPPHWTTTYHLNGKEHHTTMKVINTIHCKLDFPLLYDNAGEYWRGGSYFLLNLKHQMKTIPVGYIPYRIVINMLQTEFIPKLHEWTATYWSFLI